MVEESLEKLLQECTVQLDACGSKGTGFFVAPGLILSCAHVIKKSKSEKADITVSLKNDDFHYTARIVEIREQPALDIALLSLNLSPKQIPKHSCVYIDDSPLQLNDELYSFGYPQEYPDGDSAIFKYEGESFKGENLLFKLKEGQANYGSSGSPVLNIRTGGIVGIIN